VASSVLEVDWLVGTDGSGELDVLGSRALLGKSSKLDDMPLLQW
jgi:hypothetical protein